MDVLHRYAESLIAVGSKLVIVSANDTIQKQLDVTGITDLIGVENIYLGDERVGSAVRRAHAAAALWVEAHGDPSGADGE